MHRDPAIATRVPGRLERLINKAGLSALHLRGIKRPNGRFMESDISGTDRALIKFSTASAAIVERERDGRREKDCVGISSVERDPPGQREEQACHDLMLAFCLINDSVSPGSLEIVRGIEVRFGENLCWGKDIGWNDAYYCLEVMFKSWNLIYLFRGYINWLFCNFYLEILFSLFLE